MSDNPLKKNSKAQAKAKRRRQTQAPAPDASQEASPREQGGAAEDGSLSSDPSAPISKTGKQDVSNVEPIDGGPWPFALGPQADEPTPDNVIGDVIGSDSPGELAAQPIPLDDAAPSLNPEVRKQLVLVKHGHRYVFRYERGEETKVLSGLVDLARDPQSELDWFDAAVLSHQLGERMSEQLERLRRA